MSDLDYNRHIDEAVTLMTGAQARMGEHGRDLDAAEKMAAAALRIIRACRAHDQAQLALADAAEELSRAQGSAVSLRGGRGQ